MKKNIGTIAGITVNTTEDLCNKVKTSVPEKKEASKAKVRQSWKSVKDAYKATREGTVSDERLQEPIYKRALELTEGK